MLETQDVVIGIDGGGTHTRIMVSDLMGNVLSYLKKGSASVYRDLQAQENVNQAIIEALSAAGKEFHQVRGLAAGIAGYDTEADLEWVQELTAVEGLTCPKSHFNDAVTAHYGALLTKPGIVALSGTGSIVTALTEEGQYIRNFDFHHYAPSAARLIAYDTVYEVLAGNGDDSDSALIHSMLEHWKVHTVQELHSLARQGFTEDRRLRDRTFAQFTPIITEAASNGSRIARRVSDHAIHQIKIGIELLAPSFSGDTIAVAFTGSVINSPYFKKKLTSLLALSNHKYYTVVQSKFSPVTGSVLYALSQLPGHSLNEDLIRNLEKSSHTQP
ncbi:BadF/BadG/BcrA/BcrD ATPase family protein [Paenibacillus wynnii]|uniref:BadF/BadG/BcrA/BcrD ATPase family protein n=1 Tax=Paenibacillus wynnii TaxID=268407 RepID=UPI00278DC76B|nr:BadF/BadG/BcrA/BcrD ATPase family protein [Paenibacillus wynnii]MDQ0192444.1 glucosamine kinase [Paenibacillus wynnii]